MPDITSELNAFKSAVFGKEVRDGLISAIRKMNAAVDTQQATDAQFRTDESAARTAFQSAQTQRQEAFEAAQAQRQSTFESNLTGRQTTYETNLIDLEDIVSNQKLVSYLDVDGISVLGADDNTAFGVDESFNFSEEIGKLQSQSERVLWMEKAFRNELAGRDERLAEQQEIMDEMDRTIQTQASQIETLETDLAAAVSAANALTNRVASLEAIHANSDVIFLAN